MDESSIELPPSITRVDGIDAGPALRIDGERSSGVVQLHGAHVTSFAPHGGREMLWMSELAGAGRGTAIRGGVPVCVPWFGAGISGDMKPSHGPARLGRWRLVEAHDVDGVVSLRFEIAAQDLAGLPGAPAWPQGLVVGYVVRFADTLELELTAQNTSAQPLTCEAALHTYLAVDDVRGVAVVGAEGAATLDQLTGDRFENDGPIVFDGEVDAIVRLDGAPLQVAAREDLGAPAMVELTRAGSSHVIVWNPSADKTAGMSDVPGEAWTDFVCLESACVREGAITLDAGEQHVLSASYAPGR